jgi:hypothetical protein
LPFGSKIIDFEYVHSSPGIIDLTGRLPVGKATIDMYHEQSSHIIGTGVYDDPDPYPNDWISYYAGGGLSFGEHTSYLSVRVYPARYFPVENQLWYIEEITVTISYIEPDEPLIDDTDMYDLLIISPEKFITDLQPLINHKNINDIKTVVMTTQEIYGEYSGRDNQEKIKYAIKDAIESWDIKYVLLVGGLDGQSRSWNIPVRRSHVVPLVEQEYPEPSFISDLYYADIFDSEGGFSSWDSNENNIFAEWNQDNRDVMDVYPDVYLGRLACRDKYDVKIMVDKITTYEKYKSPDSWFKNFAIITGDHWNDTQHINEGELIALDAMDRMPEFTLAKCFSSERDINRETVKSVIDPGCGFAYFCGHGSPHVWTTHFPPNGTEWATGFKLIDILFLKNKYRLPVVVVGGCLNGLFNVSLFHPMNRYRIAKCWAWQLTSKIGGGAIATIANTGLGTHAVEDMDYNSIPDYNEVLDGWLELRFFELFGTDNYKYLGENHGQTMTEYLNRFIGNDAEMDTKMVQQWELFGDPSLSIGGGKEMSRVKDEINTEHILINTFFVRILKIFNYLFQNYFLHHL